MKRRRILALWKTKRWENKGGVCQSVKYRPETMKKRKEEGKGRKTKDYEKT
jgi:hypothetical protein